MQKNIIIIDMPRKLENNMISLEFLASNLYNSTKDIKDSMVILDFTKTRWLEANLTAILGAIFYTLYQNGNNIGISGVNDSIARVLNKNSFLESFGVLERIEDTYDSTIKYASFNPEEKVHFQKYLKEEFLPKIKLRMTPEFNKELRLNLEEVFQNARIHGESKCIFVCGQYFYKTQSVKFTIVNLGKTIPENVWQKLKTFISPEKCIDWATKEGNSTKVDTSGGIGLFQLSEFLKENEGKLQIISSLGFWQQDRGFIEKNCLEHPFLGTIVNIDVRINNKIYLSSKERNKLNRAVNNIF